MLKGNPNPVVYIQGIDRRTWRVEVHEDGAVGCTWEKLEPCELFEAAYDDPDLRDDPRYWYPMYPLRRKHNGGCSMCGGKH